MKSCPTCNRTFEDTFTFCLIDGSVLSAPIDSAAGKPAPPARDTNPPRTEVLTTAIEPEPLPPTQAGTPTPDLQPTITAPPPVTPHGPADELARPLAGKRSAVLPKVLIAIAVVLAAAVLGVVVLWVLSKSGNRNNARVDANRSPSVTSASPTATELNIRISHNGCVPAGWTTPQDFPIVVLSYDENTLRQQHEISPSHDFQITVKRSLAFGYNYWARDCMVVTINGRRAKQFPAVRNDTSILITTDNYQQFLE
jgi:hypothetical protein